MTSSELVSPKNVGRWLALSGIFFRVALRSLVICPALPSASLNPAATALGKFERASEATRQNATHISDTE